MRNVLIISYNFPPEGGPAVQRISKFVKYLELYQYKAIVLTSLHEMKKKDESLLKDIPQNTEIYKAIDWGNYLPGDIRNKLLRGMFVPDKESLWQYSAYKTAKKILKKHKIDIIFSTSPPHSTHLLALKLNKIFKIPWVSDFRDEWTNNPSFYKYSFKSKHYFYEREVLDSTDSIIVCTESAYNNFKKNSNNQISLIRNGYDPMDFKEIDKYYNKNNSEIIIAYCGRINKLHSLTNFFKTLCKLKSKYNAFPFKVKLIGTSSKKLMKSYGIIKEDVEFIDYLPHKKCLKTMNSADLLLLSATNMNKTEFIPGKVYEYIKLRKPILSILCKFGELSSFLDSYGNSINVLDEKIDDIEKALLEILDMKKKNQLNLSDNFDFINKFSRKEQTKELVNIFSAILQN